MTTRPPSIFQYVTGNIETLRNLAPDRVPTRDNPPQEPLWHCSIREIDPALDVWPGVALVLGSPETGLS